MEKVCQSIVEKNPILGGHLRQAHRERSAGSSLQVSFKNKEACPSSGDFGEIFEGYLGDIRGIFGGYLGDIWGIVGGDLEDIWRKFVGNLEEIKRRLEVKHLMFKNLIF